MSKIKIGERNTSRMPDGCHMEQMLVEFDHPKLGPRLELCWHNGHHWFDPHGDIVSMYDPESFHILSWRRVTVVEATNA